MSEDEVALVKCGTSKGDFTIKFIRKWSPIGYDRAVELFERGFYDNSHFYRVLPGFLVQFGISYSEDKELMEFAYKTIPDDKKIPELRQFQPGYVSYAGSGDNSRKSQLFISYGSAKKLGTKPWETPLGEVIEGMDNIQNLNSEYKEKPKQHRIKEGRSYIDSKFPRMDYFLTCSVKRTTPNAAPVVDDKGSAPAEVPGKDNEANVNKIREKPLKVESLTRLESGSEKATTGQPVTGAISRLGYAPASGGNPAVVGGAFALLVVAFVIKKKISGQGRTTKSQ